MAFTGYCTTLELAKFLDIGVWQKDVTLTSNYASTNSNIDTCESVAHWAATTDGSLSLNSATKKIGTYSINLIKSGTTTNSVVYYVNNSTPSFDFTGKDLCCWIYIKDSSTYAKLATMNCLQIRFGNDYNTNYYYINKNKSDLAIGWNCITLNTTIGSKEGTVTLSTCDSYAVELTLVSETTTLSAGEILTDCWFLTANNLYLSTTSANGLKFYLIKDGYHLYENGVEISTENYTVDLNNGHITFSVDPAEGSSITADYYLVEDFSNDDLEYYITLGAYELERDTLQKFREVELIDFKTDVNEGLDYYNYNQNKKYIEFDYSPILSVSNLVVNGTSVTPNTLKIKGNKVFLTNDSEVSSLTGEHDKIIISFKYGITDTVANRTDEDLIRLQLAREANKFCAAAIMSSMPLGRNVLLDNNKTLQLSSGNVRPEIFNENLTNILRNTYEQYVAKLKSLSVQLI